MSYASLLILAATLVSASPAIADEVADMPGTTAVETTMPSAPSNNKLGLEAKKWEVGLGYSTFKYEEPGVMKDSGTLKTLAGAYTFLNEDGDRQYRFEAAYETGNNDYDGAYQDGTPVKDHGSYKILDARVRKGWVNKESANLMWVPFAGLAYRGLDQRDQGPGSYRREITYWYLPLGTEVTYLPDARPNLRLRATAELDYLVLGKVKTHISEVDPNLKDDVNRQSSGYGAHLALAADTMIGDYAASFGPYLQWWKVEQSDYSYQQLNDGTWRRAWEPANNMLTAGVMASLLF